MEEIITKSSNSIESKAYLLGTFSNKYFAKPIYPYSNYNLDLISFELNPIKKLDLIEKIICFFKLIKVHQLALLLNPLLLLTSFLYGNYRIDMSLFLVSVSSLFFMSIGVILLKDVNDHVSVRDRYNYQMGNKYIREGYFKAFIVRRMALAYLLVSFLCCIYILSFSPLETWFSVLFGIFVGSVLALTSRRANYFFLHEVVSFLALGPAFFIGFSGLFSIKIDVLYISLSVITGLYVSFYFLASKWSKTNFEQLSRPNFVFNYSFDQFKYFSQIYILLILAVNIFIAFYLSKLLLIPSFFSSFVCFWMINKIHNPVSNRLAEAPNQIIWASLINCFLIAGCFYL